MNRLFIAILLVLGLMLSSMAYAKPNDFISKFERTWTKQQHRLPYEVNLWAQKIVEKENIDAAHLWSTVQGQVPSSFLNAARASHLYLLWKIRLPQTFFTGWISALSNPDFAASRWARVLNRSLKHELERWLRRNPLFLSNEQIGQLQNISNKFGPYVLTLKAWNLIGQGEQALATLKRLPKTHPLKMPLARTVLLARARANNTKGALAVLKQEFRPAVLATQSPKELSQHHLQFARIVYQSGKLKLAETIYSKIPTGSSDYKQAQEEMLWIWIRQGNLPRLRGALANFESTIFKGQFAPDRHVVRAISNLKLCYYDKVMKNIDDFVASNKRWADKIDKKLRSSSAQRKAEKDPSIRLAEAALKQNRHELRRLHWLYRDSVNAPVPAVGKQKHWFEALRRQQRVTARAIDRRNQQVRRSWTSRQIILKTAIQRMRFVKVELRNQLRKWSRTAARPLDPELLDEEATTTKKQLAKQQRAVFDSNDAELVFPFDGLVWADELFKLRGVAQTACLKGMSDA